MSEKRIDTGVLGATGAVGQQLVRLLAGHPWFRPAWLAASGRSAGHRYADVIRGARHDLPEEVIDLKVEEPAPGRGPRLLFSALDASVAADLEPALAAAGHVVVSNTRTHRMAPDVPLLVPEINPDHLQLLGRQAATRAWRGRIVTNPNCSTIFLALALAALREFEPSRVVVTTLQAASGAGHPGVPSLDLLGNVIPFIDGEEEKIETETRKILGRLESDGVRSHEMRISASTTRVPVLDGHTESISVGFERAPRREDVIDAFGRFAGRPQQRELPTAPPRPIVYVDAPDRPQPRVDADRAGGMAVTIGRLRPCQILDWKFMAVGHNTIRGAAGAAILNAELMMNEGWLD